MPCEDRGGVDFCQKQTETSDLKLQNCKSEPTSSECPESCGWCDGYHRPPPPPSPNPPPPPLSPSPSPPSPSPPSPSPPPPSCKDKKNKCKVNKCNKRKMFEKNCQATCAAHCLEKPDEKQCPKDKEHKLCKPRKGEKVDCTDKRTKKICPLSCPICVLR